MPLIMILYHFLSACLVGLLVWNFTREKKKVEDLVLYLLVIVPLVLRILRIK